MTRPTSSASDGIAVLKASTMEAEYQTKRPLARPAGVSFNPEGRGLRRFLLLSLLCRRTGVLALGGGVALDELDHGHRSGIAEAEARLQDAQVAAGALGVARAEGGE